MAPPAPFDKLEPGQSWSGHKGLFAFHGTGDEFAALLGETGWSIHTSWGLDGWDLGEWPYLLYASKLIEATMATPFGRIADDPKTLVLEYCEGDLWVKAFATAEEAYAKIDEFWLEQQTRNPRLGPDLSDYATVDLLPYRLRGPFSWARLDAADKTVP